MNVFAIAQGHMSWLSARQAVTAGNIANADTPGFKARRLAGFGEELHSLALPLSRSNPLHMQVPGRMAENYQVDLQDNPETSLSGNDVNMEQEMRTAGENSRLFAADIGLLRSFHKLYMMSVKG